MLIKDPIDPLAEQSVNSENDQGTKEGGMRHFLSIKQITTDNLVIDQLINV